MADVSAIEWTDATWNPVTGCDRVSPGCAHCYALTLAKRLKAMGQPHYQRDGDPKTSGPGFGVSLHPDALETPLRWRRPRMVFVNSMSNLFHEEIPLDFIREVFRVMHEAKQHVFQVLTKRPERALEVMRELLWRGEWQGRDYLWDPSPNVWLGVSIENARYTWRADVLREIPAAVRFISAEPLLGSLIAPQCDRVGGPCRGWRDGKGCGHCSEGRLSDWYRSGQPDVSKRQSLDLTGIDWLIVGGESGKGARTMDLAWASELVAACREAGVACFVKQLGKGYTGKGKAGDPDEWPEDLRVREMPSVAVPA